MLEERNAAEIELRRKVRLETTQVCIMPIELVASSSNGACSPFMLHKIRPHFSRY
jgi:hypothetical protein